MADLPSSPRPPLQSRRRFFATLGAVTAGAAGTVAYARVWEPERLQLTHRRIATRQPGSVPLRVLHLSDLHASEVVALDFIAHAIDVGLQQRPDLILLTGDYVTRPYDGWTDYVAVLRRLADAAPTFACLGNHDGGDPGDREGRARWVTPVQKALSEAGITLLQNTSVRLRVAERDCCLIGVGDFWSGECNPPLAFADVPPPEEALRLVLNHNPDAKILFRGFEWDLMLCGHTHGGQLRLPLLGTPFAPVEDKAFVEGLHTWQGQSIYITRGVGNLHGVRFNCPPEVSLLELT